MTHVGPRTMIQFTVPGRPVGKGRPRSFVRKGHGKLAGTIGHHTPEKTVNYEALVKSMAFAAMAEKNLKPFDKPIALHLNVCLPVTDSWPQWKKDAALLGRVLPTMLPDLDNVVKAILDGGNDVLWIDDKQVVNIHADKKFAEIARVDVTVIELDAQCSGDALKSKMAIPNQLEIAA